MFHISDPVADWSEAQLFRRAKISVWSMLQIPVLTKENTLVVITFIICMFFQIFGLENFGFRDVWFEEKNCKGLKIRFFRDPRFVKMRS